MTDGTTYDDGRISCDESGISIGWYYPWGAKHVPYGTIRGVETRPLTGVNKIWRWRLWGSGDFVHWWNLDPGRTHKEVALVLDLGRRVRPTITPDDPGAVERLLRRRMTA